MARARSPILIFIASCFVACAGAPAQPDRGPEYRACKAGELEGCLSFAESRGEGAEERRDALVALQFACHLEHVPSCRKLGEWMQTEEQSTRGVEASNQACEAGDLRACVAIVDEMPRARAQPLLAEACEQNIGEACNQLAVLLGQGLRVSQNLEQRFELEEKACELDSAEGCVAAGQALVFGSGVEVDTRRGVELLERGCDEGAVAGCTVLARIFSDGMGVEADLERGRSYAQKAKGESPEDQLFVSTFVLHADGCARSLSIGCFNAAEMRRRGDEIERNITIARDLYREACRDDVQSACARVDDFEVAWEQP